MARWLNVHLMFCEGPHDAAFLTRLLKKSLDFEKIQLKISELPYPLANVLKSSFEARAADDLRLDLAKKFFLPDFTLAKDSCLVLIFNYGGSNRPTSIPPFLAKFFPLLKTSPFSKDSTPVEFPSYKYSIFADADSTGAAAALASISEELKLIDEEPWLSEEWIALNGSKGMMQITSVGSASAYVWARWDADEGTLEDVVLECISDTDGLQKAQVYLDDRFDWTPPANALPEAICATAAKRLKATFCLEGQRKKPGGSLGVILDQTDLLDPEAIGRSRAAQDCVAFLRGWTAA